MDEDATIYKLIGTALVKQERQEAKLNVSKRLEFIQSELYVFAPIDYGLYVFLLCIRRRIEGVIKGLDEKMDKQRQELMDLQMKLQHNTEQASA